jgi:hypothetical protein
MVEEGVPSRPIRKVTILIKTHKKKIIANWCSQAVTHPSVHHTHTHTDTTVPNFQKKTPSFTSKLTHPTLFSPEDGDSMYLQNIKKTAHIHTV